MSDPDDLPRPPQSALQTPADLPQTRWDLAIQPGQREIRLAAGLLLEWKADLPANAPEGVMARTVAEDGFDGLEIVTPHNTQWIRLCAALNRIEEAPLVAVQVLLRLEAVNATAPALVEPMLARRSPAASSRREPLAATRARLALRPGQWHCLHGLFRVAPSSGRNAYDFMMNLPEGYRLHIARLDIDWLHSPAHAAADSAEDEVLHLLPFAAEPLAADLAAPQTGLATGAQPALRSLAETLAHAPRDLSALAAHLLPEAGQPGPALLLQALFDRAGLPLLPEAIAGRPAGSLPDAGLTGSLLREHLAPGSSQPLDPLDHLALHAIADSARAAPGGVLRLTAPRSLSLTLTGAATAADRSYWGAMAAAGLIGGPDDAAPADQRLDIAPAARLAPVALAFLRSAAVTAAGGVVLGEQVTGMTGGWRQSIVGYPADGPSDEIGLLTPAPGMAGAGARWLLARPDAEATARPGRAAVVPENCFAIVLRLDGETDCDSLTNIDNCLVFDSLADLRAALADAGPRLLHKPVVPLNRHISHGPDHLVTAVARHWAYGGQYVLTSAQCSYDPANGEIRLAAPAQDDIQRLVLSAAILALPLSELLQSPVEDDLFLPSAGFGVAVTLPEPPDDAALVRLHRAYRPDRLGAAMHERLAGLAALDHAVLARIPLSTNRHWPVEPMIAARLLRHDRLMQLMRACTARPARETAAAALEMITPASPDLLRHAAVVEAFLIRLSESPATVLALSTEQFQAFIDLARQTPDAADDVARNLATYADRICQGHIANIIPLFELLATCLPAQAVIPALSFAALGFRDAPDRYVLRLAECMKRYGDDTLLATFLANLCVHSPKKVGAAGLLRSFQPLLASAFLPVLAAQTGSGVIQQIEATVEVADRFVKAVQTGDREQALRLIRDPDAMRTVDFMRWMDGLRGLSNELRAMALPVAELALAGINSLPRQRLAAIILSDQTALAALAEAGQLADANAQNAVARHLLGDHAMLDALIAAPYAGSPWHPMHIAGNSTAEVFANAGAALAGLPARDDGPLVTVIMSAFNPDIDLMAAALQSIDNQTHRNTEVIVIDDASTAENAALIRDLAARHPRVRLIRLDVNSGPYVGRNLALREARGAFVAIHDADDWAHPERLAAQLAAFEACPEARLVTAQHIRIDRAGRVQLEGGFQILGDGPMTSLFRREVFDEIGAFALVRSRGDVEMRERLRSYYGHQAIAVLPMPMLLCLAESSTLSQTILANKAEYLQLFRTHISRRPVMAGLRRDGIALGPQHRLLVPHPLRAEMEKDLQE